MYAFTCECCLTDELYFLLSKSFLSDTDGVPCSSGNGTFMHSGVALPSTFSENNKCKTESVTVQSRYMYAWMKERFRETLNIAILKTEERNQNHKNPNTKTPTTKDYFRSRHFWKCVFFKLNAIKLNLIPGGHFFSIIDSESSCSSLLHSLCDELRV